VSKSIVVSNLSVFCVQEKDKLLSKSIPATSDDKDSRQMSAVSQPQQSVGGKHGDGDTKSGQTSCVLREAFIDQVRQSLHELRHDTRSAIAYRRANFL